MQTRTNKQEDHLSLMKEIVHSLSDLPIVLKGGTALLLAYNLDRFSEDLDFDANKKLNIQSKLKAVLDKHTESYAIKLAKNTDTVQRFKIHYQKNGIQQRLKIETSYRDVFSKKQIVEDKIGEYKVKTYAIEHLIDQKMKALEGRTQARDLYDVNFLLRKYTDAFPRKLLVKADEIMSDVSGVESKYKEAFAKDTLFTKNTLTSILVDFMDIKKDIKKRIEDKSFVFDNKIKKKDKGLDKGYDLTI